MRYARWKYKQERRRQMYAWGERKRQRRVGDDYEPDRDGPTRDDSTWGRAPRYGRAR